MSLTFISLIITVGTISLSAVAYPECENDLEPQNLSLFEKHPDLFPQRLKPMTNEELGEILSYPVDALGFTTMNQLLKLRSAGITRVFHVVELSESELAKKATFMNSTHWQKIHERMKDLGLSFTMNIRNLKIGPKKRPDDEVLNRSVRILNLETAAITRLQNNGYLRIRDLVAVSPTEFLFGAQPKALARVQTALAEMELYLGMYLPDLERIESVRDREAKKSIETLNLSPHDLQLFKRKGLWTISDLLNVPSQTWESISTPSQLRLNNALKDAGFPPLRR